MGSLLLQKVGGSSISYGPYTTAFAAVVVSRGGIVTDAEKGYLTTFETSMGSDLAEFDRLWIHGLSNRIAAKTSFTNPLSTIMIEVNSPTWVPYQGFKGNGSTSYVDTNFNCFTQGIKYTLNNASASTYVTDNIVSGGASFATYNGSSVGAFLYPQIATNQPLWYINNSASQSSVGTGNSLALSTITRSSSSRVNLYKRGIFNAANGAPSNGIPNLNHYICGGSFNGGLVWAYTANISLTSFGSANFDQLNYYNAVQILGTSLGWAV